MLKPDDIVLQDRPLLVCDIDEVVLQFLTPFDNYLRANGHTLLPRSFRLHGNIVDLETGMEASHLAVDDFEEGFYASQAEWQTPAEKAVDVLHDLSAVSDIVFLTAMPPRHYEARRALLDSLTLHYPMIATETPKGAALAALHNARAVPVFFIDDIARNLESVRQHVPDCNLLHLMANDAFRKLAPATGDHIAKVDDWGHARRLILDQINTPSG